MFSLSEFVNSNKSENGKNHFELLPSIFKISGPILNNELHGKIEIIYHDGTKMKAIASSGVINGKVFIFNANKKMQAIGLYKVRQKTIQVQLHSVYSRTNTISLGWTTEWTIFDN